MWKNKLDAHVHRHIYLGIHAIDAMNEALTATGTRKPIPVDTLRGLAAHQAGDYLGLYFEDRVDPLVSSNGARLLDAVLLNVRGVIAELRKIDSGYNPPAIMEYLESGEELLVESGE